MPNAIQCLLISDFNAETFKAHIENHEDPPHVAARCAPFGHVVPVLKGPWLNPGGSLPAFAIIWTQPDRVISSFKSALSYRSVSLQTILDEVDAYCRPILEFQARVRNLFIPTWLLPWHGAGHGMRTMENGTGITNILMRMNLRLAENFENAPAIHLLDAQRWVGPAGRNAFSAKLWYMCKVPFGHEVFRAAAADIKAAVRGLSGEAKKLIVLDLDNTLWGGVVGEVGWQGVKLGGHDALGEAYVDFQEALKAMTRRGVVLGICSKNTESLALEMFRSHPEMILTLDDFAGWRINWQDKARNLAELADELNLGLQSTVFIDDSPTERARIRDALPEVTVPEWPQNAMFYKDALLNLHYFDFPQVSREDLFRSRMYIAERKRRTLRKTVKSADDWLKTLNLKIRVEELNETNLPRAAQLLNKTNQMNLSTRRLSASELLEWLKEGTRKLWTFRVADKFGDSGLCGILSLQTEGETGRIVDFVLSCRVIGRRVEETMLHAVITSARSAGLRQVYADYLPTSRNEPCRLFFERSGMRRDAHTNRFIWETEQDYTIPESITIEGPSALVRA